MAKKADFLKALDEYLAESAANRVRVEEHLALAKAQDTLLKLVVRPNVNGLVSMKAKHIAELTNGKKFLKKMIKSEYMDPAYVLIIKKYL
jgi:hypothetical protein